MARRAITLDQKIEKAKKSVIQAKTKYEAAQEELNALLKKKRDMDNQKLIKAFTNGDKTIDEVIDFINGKTELEEE